MHRPNINTEHMDNVLNFCNDVRVCNVQSGVTIITTMIMDKLLAHVTVVSFATSAIATVVVNLFERVMVDSSGTCDDMDV